jgi:hypothetical protein
MSLCQVGSMGCNLVGNNANIPQIKSWHFGGAAFLGDIWSRINDPQVDQYLDTLRLQLV